MNADELMRHYERIADAPQAVARLRRFVLDLAVRGKLVPQDSRDEPASDLLKKIAAEKARLFRQGDLRKEKPLRPIAKEAPFRLPPGWTWTQLGHLSKLVTSGSRDWASHYSDDGATFVRMGNLSRGSYRLRLDNVQRVRPPAGTEGARTRLEAGDVLISITGDVGLLGLIPAGFGEAYINQHTCVVRPVDDLQGRFLPELFRSSFAQDQFNGPQRGIKNSFRLTDVTEFLVPLPPLAEQHRIVAKVDELMALCDRLEAARAQREAARDRLERSCLARLDTPDPETFREDARFALDALPALTARPDQIKQLRQTILNLAVRGKLVPQDADDEPASSLLAKIAEIRRSLVAERKAPKPKVLPTLDEIELPFDMPPGWTWALLGDLCYQVSDGPHFSPQYVPSTNGVPFLSTRNVQASGFDLSSLKYVSRADHEEFCKRVRPERGDIIYTKGGTTGIARVNDLDFEFSVWVHLAVLRIEKERLHPKFVELALNSPHCYEQSQRYTQGTSNSDLGLTRMIKITVPLPPLREQHRIVAKVDELMALCDRLEASLTQADEHRRRLLEALLHQALEPAASLEEQAA